MRKITQKIVTAFMRGESAKLGNTETNGNALYLHGHRIAYKDGSKIYISTCGWSTNTTKERLNAIPGVSIVQKAGIWYLNGQEWDGNEIAIN